MDELKQDIKVIRESQIRMEQDIKYHIKRTDLLEEKVNSNTELLQPLIVWKWMRENFKFILVLLGCIASIVIYLIRSKV
jgi:hypothetical protein